MKAYTITVNGVAYDVTVEERAAGAAPVAPAPVVMAAPVAPAPAQMRMPALFTHRQLVHSRSRR